MGLMEELIEALPELTKEDFSRFGTIGLRDDSDGQGPYIEKWEYNQPIPQGFNLGKVPN